MGKGKRVKEKELIKREELRKKDECTVSFTDLGKLNLVTICNS